MWKMPARLWRRRGDGLDAAGADERQEIANGPLEQMVRLAAEVDEAEGEMLSIDCVGAAKPLFWPEIRDLRHATTFPVEI